MKHKLLRLYWSVFGYPDLPPKLAYFRDVRLNPYTNREYIPRYNSMYVNYLHGNSVERIAASHNVTMERVRQSLWKAYRTAVK